MITFLGSSSMPKLGLSRILGHLRFSNLLILFGMMVGVIRTKASSKRF